jgi:hypothetical protein
MKVAARAPGISNPMQAQQLSSRAPFFRSEYKDWMVQSIDEVTCPSIF